MHASDPTYPLFPIFAFLGFVLSAIPLSWHFQAWNSGTCAFMIWTGVTCLVTFINSIVWAENALNVAPIWCDISSQIILAASVGIPASTLCISRRLYRITSAQTASITRRDKIRAIYTDLAIAVGLPVLMLVLHTIVQGHRFNILEEYGCTSVTFSSIVSYFIYYPWPIAIGLVSLVYSSLILRTFYMRRIQFNQLISSSGMINPSRYLRLMLLALIDISCTIPIGIYTIYVSLKGVPLNPWISWDDTHFDFGRVQLIPAVIWRSDFRTNTSIEITRWVPVACAFIFFALFGFAEEAMKNYRRAFWFVARRLGFRPASEGGFASSKGKSSIFSGLKSLKLKSDFRDLDSLPVHVKSTGPVIPSARRDMRKSILESDSRSTICFPDDNDVELGPYRTSYLRKNSCDVPSSPSSSTSTCAPRTPVTPTTAPPSYKASTRLDLPALSSNKEEIPSHSRSPSPPAVPFVTFPEDAVEPSQTISRPSSYFAPSITSRLGGTGEDREPEEDDIYISEAYLDSRPTSPVYRVPTPMPLMSSELPTPPPPVLAFHRPFSPPSVYPVSHTTASRDASGHDGLVVTVHTQSSTETL